MKLSMSMILAVPLALMGMVSCGGSSICPTDLNGVWDGYWTATGSTVSGGSVRLIVSNGNQISGGYWVFSNTGIQYPVKGDLEFPRDNCVGVIGIQVNRNTSTDLVSGSGQVYANGCQWTLTVNYLVGGSTSNLISRQIFLTRQ